eukprot:TRINITY_DN10288_c0_g2_i5.p1 TRINITY_DN10288_c0_g2~~TRINITY_DN10288_c0_g2_i5.p1  ORF type:complete len:416 (+),score=53.14 TRINITY_DN10288_c0_g2_i5:335-1582(+)
MELNDTLKYLYIQSLKTYLLLIQEGNMSMFLGIGLGPIQTGIFLSGAHHGGMERIVIAEVDADTVQAVRASSGISINIASSESIYQEHIGNVEIYNPTVPEDLQQLIAVAAQADEIATALPGVNFFKHIASWLREGFSSNPEHRRFIYTAENDNYAAEKFKKEIGIDFPRTCYLNTVVGKMSKVFSIHDTPEFHLTPLCPGLERAHLVEEFNRILISSAPEIEMRKVKNLHVKSDLIPFEEAKLYGHNAIHFMLGWKGAQLGLTEMHQLSEHPELLNYARDAFLCECGKALCHKWKDADPLFTPEGFSTYADDLLRRMVNPFLRDRIDRIIRDLPRKLDCHDRVIGTIRMCLEQEIIPEKFMKLAVDCLSKMGQNQGSALLNNCRVGKEFHMGSGKLAEWSFDIEFIGYGRDVGE